MKEQEQEKEFWHYVEIANEMPPQTADNMLIVYGYYKQATTGDNHEERPQQSSNVIQTFKHDAWKRLEGMPRTTARKKYIETIKRLLKEAEEDAAAKKKEPD